MSCRAKLVRRHQSKSKSKKDDDEVVIFDVNINNNNNSGRKDAKKKHNTRSKSGSGGGRRREELPTIGKNNSLSRAAVKRVAKIERIRRVSRNGASYIQSITRDFAHSLIADSALAVRHRGAKTLNPKDTDLVLRIRNNNVTRVF